MTDYIKSMFSENGDISMMRVGTFICIISAVAIAIIGLITKQDLSSVSMLAGTFLAAGMTGKAVQKFAEKKES